MKITKDESKILASALIDVMKEYSSEDWLLKTEQKKYYAALGKFAHRLQDFGDDKRRPNDEFSDCLGRVVDKYTREAAHD